MDQLPTGLITYSFPANLVDAHMEGLHIALGQRPDEVGPIQSRYVRDLLVRHCARPILNTWPQSLEAPAPFRPETSANLRKHPAETERALSRTGG